MAAQSSFAQSLWVIFGMTGAGVLVIVMGIRLLFRRGKSVRDL
jgi:DNA repair ATPase RecN